MIAGGDVSVVIPVRDGARYLPAAIDSVVGGSVSPAEVVVVDDGSTDSTAEIAADRGDPVRIIRSPPRGVASATNLGLAEVARELVAFIDADDLWSASKLELQLDALAADSTLDAVFGHAREFQSPDLTPAERAEVEPRPGNHPVRLRSTMLAWRALFDRVGPFDESLRVGEFVDWHARASELGMRSRMLEETVLHRRLHASNLGRRAAGDRIDYVRVARAALRRRAAQEAGR